MSVSYDLQVAIFAALSADAGVAGLVEDRVFDGVDADAQLPYVSFGPSQVIDDATDCIAARVETQQIDCWSADGGSLVGVKRINDAIRDALHGADLEIAAGAVVLIEVTSTRAMLDPDGLTAHGVVSLEIHAEE